MFKTTKVSKTGPVYQYSEASIGTLNTNTPLRFPKNKIPVAKPSTDTQSEYKYLKASIDTQGRVLVLLQRSTTASLILLVSTVGFESTQTIACQVVEKWIFGWKWLKLENGQ
ncbi:hypothetical protein V6N13_082820 [Hibiscus sabdariffa]